MLLFYLWLPGFHLNLSLYMSELANTLDLQTKRNRGWYDNPEHFYVSPGGIDIRSEVGSDLGTAPRPMTMDDFELTHFPLELILADGKMIPESHRIDGHEDMLNVLCANKRLIAMLEVIATNVESQNRKCLHQLHHKLGEYFISDLHSLCKRLRNRAKKLNANSKPTENRSRQDDTTMDGSSGEAGQ